MGLKYYLGSESDFAKLGRGATWKNAATQILFSTSGEFSCSFENAGTWYNNIVIK